MFIAPTTARKAGRFGAVLIGLAVPSLMAGRVPIAVLLALGGIALFAASPRLPTPQDMRAFFTRSPLAVSVAAMLAVWLISTIVTLDPPRSWAVWAQTAALLVGAALLHAVLVRDPALIETALRALIVGALAAGIISVIALFIWPEALGPFRTAEIRTAQAAISALRGYGSEMSCLAPVVLWAGWRLGGSWRAAGALFLPLAVAIVIGTNSLAGMLGIIAAILAVLLAALYVGLPSTARRPYLIGLVALAAAVAALVLAQLPTPPYSAATELQIPLWLVDAHRQLIWGFAFDSALSSPWIGFGLDTAGRIPGAKAFLPGLGPTETMPSHAHNWMLELFVESGILGLGAALVAFGCFIRRLLHDALTRDPAAFAAIALSGAYFGSGLVNFSIWSAWWQSAFLVLIALTLAAVPRRKGGRAG